MCSAPSPPPPVRPGPARGVSDVPVKPARSGLAPLPTRANPWSGWPRGRESLGRAPRASCSRGSWLPKAGEVQGGRAPGGPSPPLKPRGAATPPRGHAGVALETPCPGASSDPATLGPRRQDPWARVCPPAPRRRAHQPRTHTAPGPAGHCERCEGFGLTPTQPPRRGQGPEAPCSWWPSRRPLTPSRTGKPWTAASTSDPELCSNVPPPSGVGGLPRRLPLKGRTPEVAQGAGAVLAGGRCLPAACAEGHSPWRDPAAQPQHEEPLETRGTALPGPGSCPGS